MVVYVENNLSYCQVKLLFKHFKFDTIHGDSSYERPVEALTEEIMKKVNDFLITDRRELLSVTVGEMEGLEASVSAFKILHENLRMSISPNVYPGCKILNKSCLDDTLWGTLNCFSPR